MRSHTLAAAGVLALVVLVAASNGTGADPLLRAEPAASQKTVNCSKPPFRSAIRGTLDANLAISAYPTVCVVNGRVKGDVIVRSTDRRCATGSRFVALSVEGGTIDGRIVTVGKRCVMAWFHVVP